MEPIRGVTETTSSDGLKVYRVADPNALTQLVGWYRFKSTGGQILLRGENRLHPDSAASGFRRLRASVLNARVNEAVSTVFGSACTCAKGRPLPWGKQHQCLEKLPAKAKKVLVGSTYRAAVEPLLQHYGVATRWLDVVDNVWIALWFACHTQVGSSEHAFHLRRSVSQESKDANAYIAMFDTGKLAPTKVPGHQLGASVRVVDLRYAVPSVYLRPHAQHGLLIAPSTLGDSSGSLRSSVRAYIEVDLGDALDWLGSGAMLSPFVLFPPAAMDEGFRRLLSARFEFPEELGTITIYGPGY